MVVGAARRNNRASSPHRRTSRISCITYLAVQDEKDAPDGLVAEDDIGKAVNS
jgi:hypothetical protein